MEVNDMTFRRKLFFVSAGALMALAPAIGWAQAVRIEVARPVTVVTPAPTEPVTVVTPAPAETRPITVVTPVPDVRPITVVATAPADTLVAPETLQVDGIRAQQVRARA